LSTGRWAARMTTTENLKYDYKYDPENQEYEMVGCEKY
jgi:hypothetical protein